MEKENSKYKILWNDDSDELADEVDTMIGKGWQPFGNPFIKTYNEVDSARFYQAIVKQK